MTRFPFPIVLAVSVLVSTVVAEDVVGERLDRTFRESVRPFVTAYCVSCHAGDEPEGDLDLAPYPTRESVADDHRRWAIVLDRLEKRDMPPKDADPRPTADERRVVAEWLRELRAYEAERNAGDPGPVLARRLSNAEYDYTIRDLTGVDLRPAAAFPVDPANESGFDNTGESLTMSPALLTKYLDAARRVSDHLVLTPDGLEFAPHPVMTPTDRDKFCVNRIIDFYRRQETDYADYFLAAWQYELATVSGKSETTLAEVADEFGISRKYLVTIHELLTDEETETVGPIAALRAMWRALPSDLDDEAAARAGCRAMRDFVVDLREELVPKVDNLTAPTVHNGSQPLVLWKNRRMAENRRQYSGGAAVAIAAIDLPDVPGVAKALTVPTDGDGAKRFKAAFERFCSLFPDAFLVSERARVYLDAAEERKANRTGRLLSAGFHSQMGYFRDDRPLYELMLDENEQRELDRLWDELDFVAMAPERQYKGFIWFDRTDSRFMREREFDFARAEDKDAMSQAKVQRLAELYLAKAEREGAGDVALGAIRRYFDDMGARFLWLERSRERAEPQHVAALLDLAERAYRRPLTAAERKNLESFYRALRDEDELSHEDAVRDVLVAILMSPHFCYRVDLPGTGDGKSDRESRPLTDHALASRLSYFLWSSMPDAELLELAEAGRLRDPEVLRSQARRMLRDRRVRGLATEFGGNWLDFRRFEEHNAVDRDRFPTFDDELRQAMFEEPLQFFVDLAGRDGSVLDFLYADYTFVDRSLARHYGIEGLDLDAGEWVRIDDARRYGRGGLLPMSVFLTKNAPGLRTSPVKRGYWVARRVLGERIPPPPPDVPDLPDDEADLGDLTLREALAKHRSVESCAACHKRFDSLGLVFEGYGPVGERRSVDLGGRPVQTTAAFPGDAGEGDGLAGLETYLREHRQEEFVDNLCRKLLAYALGRSLQPSDDPTIRSMRDRLASDGHRFGAMIDVIVSSPQFLEKQADPASAEETE